MCGDVKSARQNTLEGELRRWAMLHQALVPGGPIEPDKYAELIASLHHRNPKASSHSQINMSNPTKTHPSCLSDICETNLQICQGGRVTKWKPVEDYKISVQNPFSSKFFCKADCIWAITQ